jgi:hypothetical protein
MIRLFKLRRRATIPRDGSCLPAMDPFQDLLQDIRLNRMGRMVCSGGSSALSSSTLSSRLPSRTLHIREPKLYGAVGKL